MKSKTAWELIFTSDEYRVGKYDNCTTRIYKHPTLPNRLKIEEDGTRWAGHTGERHTYKHYLFGDDAKYMIRVIDNYITDKASYDDVTTAISIAVM